MTRTFRQIVADHPLTMTVLLATLLIGGAFAAGPKIEQSSKTMKDATALFQVGYPSVNPLSLSLKDFEDINSPFPFNTPRLKVVERSDFFSCIRVRRYVPLDWATPDQQEGTVTGYFRGRYLHGVVVETPALEASTLTIQLQRWAKFWTEDRFDRSSLHWWNSFHFESGDVRLWINLEEYTAKGTKDFARFRLDFSRKGESWVANCQR